MKKASCVLIIVLLLLLEISAKAEWVSIVELRQQVDEMGRWIQNYTDTYGRQIEVDVLPMIPNVEVVPVLRVEPLDVVPDQIHPDMPCPTTNMRKVPGITMIRKQANGCTCMRCVRERFVLSMPIRIYRQRERQVSLEACAEGLSALMNPIRIYLIKKEAS